MYRNVCYDITDGRGVITLFTWDENGKPITEIHDHESHLHFENPKGKDGVSIFGDALMKRSFPHAGDRKKWLNNNPGVKVYESLSPTREFLVNHYAGQQEEVDFRKHKLRTHYFDIEIAVEDEFPKPDKAAYPINVIGLYDNYLEQYYCWVLTEDRDQFKDHDNVNYFTFKREYELLHHYMDWYAMNTPDVITGWNIEAFDVPYLVNRLDRICFEKRDALSPVGKVRPISRKQKNKINETKTYTFEGVSLIDYLSLYKYKFIGQEKLHNYKLETVAQYELGYGKLDYEGTFKEFYKRDFKTFVEYNIHDVRLVKELDEKKGFIELSRLICNMGLCEYEAIYKSQPYIFGALLLEARARNQVMISRNPENLTEDISYAGGYVFPPSIARYTRGIATLDFSSLYPNTMICLNISPETKVGKIMEENDDEVVLKTPDKTVRLSPKKLDELLETKLVRAANNVLYVNPDIKMGVIPAFLDRLYTSRKDMRVLMVEADMKIAQIKGLLATMEEGEKKEKYKLAKQKLELDSDVCYTTQKAYKLFLNSIYGQLGSKYFPMFDLDNAEAVTLSGQKLTKSGADFLNKYFAKNYGVETSSIVFGDTDSVGIDCQPIVDDLIGSDTAFTDDNIQQICDSIDAPGGLVEAVNDHMFHITRDHFHSPLRRIEFKREKFCSEGAFVAKKRYVVRVRNNEGAPCDKFSYTGLEVRRSEHPDAVKDMLRHVIETSLDEGWSNTQYKEEVTKLWSKFREFEPGDVAYWKGYNTEKKTTGFLTSEKRTGSHARGAHYHNHILEHLNLLGKYDKIRVEDRIRFAYLYKTNVYGIDVISWKDEYPEEFKDIFEIDYPKMFSKILQRPLEPFEKISKWSKVDPNEEELQDISAL